MLDPRARTETQDKIFPFCLELRSDSDSWRFKTAFRSSAPPLLYPHQKVVQDKDIRCPGHVLDMSRTGPKKGGEIKRKGVRRIRIFLVLDNSRNGQKKGGEGEKKGCVMEIGEG